MRRLLGIAWIVCLLPVAAHAQGQSAIVGFGGYSLSGFDSHAPSLGGTVSFNVLPAVQIVGEVGRLGNVLPTTADTLFSLTRTGVTLSAIYGEGGVRLAAPNGGLAPYVEATVGVARLDFDSPRLGGIVGAASSIALDLAGRTSPIASAGGGVLARGGPLVVELGYRCEQLFGNEVVQGVFGLGQPLHAHEVRAGIGLRF